jgi:hypothetical protein
MVPSEKEPVFRPAEWISKEAAVEAFNSGSVERIRIALIDSSRCWDPEWMFPHAWRFARHEDSRIRWAAVFALDQARSELVRVLVTEEFSKDDDSPGLVLTNLASNDPDPDVRNIAGTTLLDVLGVMTDLLRLKHG